MISCRSSSHHIWTMGNKYLSIYLRQPQAWFCSTANHTKKKIRTMLNCCSTNPIVSPFQTPKHLKIHQKFNSDRAILGSFRKRFVGIKCSSAMNAKEEWTMDYYQLLGVSLDSTPQEIKEAYRRLQKKHHPDIAGEKGHKYTLMLNEAYHALMSNDLRWRYDPSKWKRSEGFKSNSTSLGYSSWNGPLRPQALCVDENRCIGCIECVHHASKTFMMDEALGSARVKVQFGDHKEKIEVSVDSCPVNCIHWVESEELPLLEFLTQPQLKEAYGIFGGGWERPGDVFAAAKYFKKQMKQQQKQHFTGKTEMQDETLAQAKARHHDNLKLEVEKFWEKWNWLRELFVSDESPTP